MVTPLRVVIADDHYLLREGLRALLCDGGEVEVCATVGSAPELMAAVDTLSVDAVITDIRMPEGTEGIDAAHAIRAMHLDVGVVVLSQHADGAYAHALLSRGTDGLAYLLKERVGDVGELMRALREVCAGRTALDTRIVDALISRRRTSAPSGLDSLSDRERDVLREMARGLANAGIARTLVLSESAVEKHISSIFSKLGHDVQPNTPPGGRRARPSRRHVSVSGPPGIRPHHRFESSMQYVSAPGRARRVAVDLASLR